MERRDWLLLSLLGGCTPLLPESGSVASLLAAGLPADGQAEPLDRSTLNFWRQQVRGSARGQGVSWEANRAPEFLLYTADKGFVPATDVDESILPSNGDANVQVQVAGFRPSAADQQKFEKSGHGSLRIDLQQAQPTKGMLETLAFSAVAALQPTKQGALPPLDQLKMDVGTAWGKWQKVPLPGGSGSWTWNFFLQKKDSLLARAASLFSLAAPIAPILGMPAIAKTALGAFDNFFGHVQSSSPTQWLFQGVELPVAATREAKDNLASPIVLHSGSYAVVPREALSAFGKAMDKLEINRGMVVPKGTKTTDVYDAARETIADITYLGLDVKVQHAVFE
ncbi:MAG TPA: hypothetical protein VL523_09690 [Terriglobia bacterium]|nr:hypothetical protein [Terriglobia bacterium]